jgi:hypothetical protein
LPRGLYERTPEMVAKNSALRAEVIRRVQAEWKKTHEPDEPLQRACGLKSSSIAYRCGTCKRVIRGPSIFWHQRTKQHTGVTVLNQGEPA